jgi:Protein of unknown function (DUF1488)
VGVREREERLRMPLTRDKMIGFDRKSATFRFVMMNGNRPLECRVSNAVFNYLENQAYPTENPDAVFLRWRETIEKTISDKFDKAGSTDLFLKDVKKRLPRATK